MFLSEGKQIKIKIKIKQIIKKKFNDSLKLNGLKEKQL